MLRASFMIAAKDLRLCLRGSQGLAQTALLGLLVIFVFSLSLPTGQAMPAQGAAAVFWLSTAFGLVLVFNALYSLEESGGARLGLLLSPAPVQAVWLGKAVAGLVLLLVTQLVFAPAALAFLNQDLHLGEGTHLAVSAQGSIDLESYAQLTVLGTLEAPAGSLRLTRSVKAALTGDDYNQATTAFSWDKFSESLYLGPASRLLAPGTTVLDPATRSALALGTPLKTLQDKNQYRTQVLEGGQVELNAGLGHLVTRAGSLIDVSGAEGSAVFISGAGTGLVYRTEGLGSAGGRVSFAGREAMFLDGTCKAAGATGAPGGVFSLRLAEGEGYADPWQGEFLPDDLVDPVSLAALTGPRQLTLFQSSGGHPAQWPDWLTQQAYLAGGAMLPAVGRDGKPRVALDLAPLAAAGFASWYLGSQNEIRFEGSIQAAVPSQLRLDAPRFAAAGDGVRVDLSAGALQLGNYSVATTPTAAADLGGAEAVFHARDIALMGQFSWNGFALSRFESAGELHFDSRSNSAANRSGGRLFNGQMTASGEVDFQAARLAPSTFSDFRVNL